MSTTVKLCLSKFAQVKLSQNQLENTCYMGFLASMISQLLIAAGAMVIISYL